MTPSPDYLAGFAAAREMAAQEIEEHIFRIGRIHAADLAAKLRALTPPQRAPDPDPGTEGEAL